MSPNFASHKWYTNARRQQQYASDGCYNKTCSFCNYSKQWAHHHHLQKPCISQEASSLNVSSTRFSTAHEQAQESMGRTTSVDSLVPFFSLCVRCLYVKWLSKLAGVHLSDSRSVAGHWPREKPKLVAVLPAAWLHSELPTWKQKGFASAPEVKIAYICVNFAAGKLRMACKIV